MTCLPLNCPEGRAAGPDGSSIREMRADDVDAVLGLERATAEAPHWARGDYEAMVAEQAEGAALTRVALVSQIDTQMIGFAVMRMLRVTASPERSEIVECELESIVVATAFRGRGVGLCLMDAILEVARSSGSGRLELEVRASNHSAIRLYERAGMTPQGRRAGYYSDPPDDALLMAKDLYPAK